MYNALVHYVNIVSCFTTFHFDNVIIYMNMDCKMATVSSESYSVSQLASVLSLMSSTFFCSLSDFFSGLAPKYWYVLGPGYHHQNWMGNRECTEGLVGNILLLIVLTFKFQFNLFIFILFLLSSLLFVLSLPSHSFPSSGSNQLRVGWRSIQRKKCRAWSVQCCACHTIGRSLLVGYRYWWAGYCCHCGCTHVWIGRCGHSQLCYS